VRFLLLFAGWATLAFIPAWWIADAYQHVIAAIAGRLVVPPGSEVEWVSLELFYPFDIGIFVGLCLASTWAAWRRRLRMLGIGTVIMIVLEVVSLAVAMLVILNALAGGGDVSPEQAGQVERLATGIIRVTGLIAASAVWFFLLGRERLSLVARTWLGGRT